MKRIKIGIALITMFGLLLGTVGIASAKTTQVHHAKVSQTTTKHSHHPTTTPASKKSAKSLTKHAS